MPDPGLLDVLRRSGGLSAVARQLVIPPTTALAAATALLPFLRGGLRRRVELADNLGTGLDELLTLLEELGGGALASRVLQQDQADVQAGETVLRAAFGPDSVSQLVIKDVAARSELEPAVVGQILPLLAMLAAGYVSARAGRMSPAERLAELGPLLDLDGEPNPLDGLIGIPDE